MTYDEAVEKVTQAFFELSDEKQVALMEEHMSDYGQDVDIFPMSQFDSYCKKKWGDRYGDFAEVMIESGNNGFDFDDLWCVYSKTEDIFQSGETPADFSYGDDELAETLISDHDFLCNVMNFSWDEIHEVTDAFNEERGE